MNAPNFDNEIDFVSTEGASEVVGKICGVFDPQQALEYFQEIASKYYDRNFGTISKSELDLLMFQIFDEAALEDDPQEWTDYKVARQLALTPQRVQNMRTRIALKSDEDVDLEKILLDIVEHESYRIIDRKDEKGCEMRLRFYRMVDVFAFRDALTKRKLYFDGSFSGLVVTTPLSAVLELLFEEIGDIGPDDYLNKDGLLCRILNKGSISSLPKEVGDSINQLLAKQEKLKLSDVVRTLAGGITSTTFSSLGSFLLSGFESINDISQVVTGSISSSIRSIFQSFRDYNSD